MTTGDVDEADGAGGNGSDAEGGDVDLEELHSNLNPDISVEEFEKRVEEKVEQMGGLCDTATAAKLVSHELDEDRVYDVGDITEHQSEVGFVAKVVSIGEVRTFERDGDDDDGKVVNIEVADETGKIRVSMWDEYADSADELEKGDVLQIEGTPKEGWQGGVEVSAKRVEPSEEEVDVSEMGDAEAIEDVEEGLSDVNLEVHVLNVGSINTFGRDDGTEGRVSNLVVADETGWIRVTLWDERADLVNELEAGDSVLLRDGYCKVRDGDVEIHVGNRGGVDRIERDVDYSIEPIPIEDVSIGETCDLDGVITDVGEKRRFDRDDGSQGVVRNVRLRDSTGELRVALWGDHAERDLREGDSVDMTGVDIKEGWNDGVEGSIGWNSTLTVEGGEDRSGDDNGSEEGSGGLDSFT
ncbi:MAG: OB-fold nucleic acid binding domain-containing protein [Halobacteria archaeon]